MSDSSVPASSESARVFGLDALRATAILGVTLAHGFAVLYPHVPNLGLLGHGGFYGVELFFVLSGFLIGQILIRRGERLGHDGSLPEFYIRRWFRTLPLFWLLVVGNVVLDLVVQGTHYDSGLVLSHAFFLRNLTGPHLAFMPESWSLAVEEWFYLLFPAALWLGLRLRGRFDAVLLVTAAAFYLFSTGVRMLAAGHPEATWGEWERIVVIGRFDALMVGILGAWLAMRFPTAWRRVAAPAAAVGLVLVVWMYVTLWRRDGGGFAAGADDFFARTWRFNLVSLGFALLLPAASRWKLARENFASTAVRKIALWSYAMYLVQHPLSRLIMPYWFTGWSTSAAQAWALFWVMLAAIIGVSAALHHGFEIHCTRLRDRVGPWLERRLSRSQPKDQPSGPAV